jgi:hypothetical protein
MDPIIEKLGNRLKTLMEDINFKWDDHALDSPDQFMTTCIHNSREYEKFEAMDPERQERIWNLFSNMLAVALQELAMDQYGNTDEESIRKVLNNSCGMTASSEYWDRSMLLAKKYFLELGLTEKQYQPIQEYFDTLPRAFIEFLVDLIRDWRLLPATKAQSIALALTDLAKEVAA